MHLEDGAHQFLRVTVFEQIAHGAGFDGRKHLVLRGRAGQHQDAALRPAVRDPPDGLDPVHARHHQVHQDDVRRKASRHRHGSLAAFLDLGRQPAFSFDMQSGLQTGPTLRRLEPGSQGNHQALLGEDGRAQLKDEQPHLSQGLFGGAAQLEQVLGRRSYFSRR
jgi:hypothetical protein